MSSPTTLLRVVDAAAPVSSAPVSSAPVSSTHGPAAQPGSQPRRYGFGAERSRPLQPLHLPEEGAGDSRSEALHTLKAAGMVVLFLLAITLILVR